MNQYLMGLAHLRYQCKTLDLESSNMQSITWIYQNYIIVHVLSIAAVGAVLILKFYDYRTHKRFHHIP